MRTGFAAAMLRRGWRPMAGGSFISYRRALKPLQTYSLRFRLDASDAHWNYMRFAFECDGRVHAAGYMKGAAVAHDGLVPNDLSYAAMGLEPFNNVMPAPVRDWLAAEHGVISTAW